MPEMAQVPLYRPEITFIPSALVDFTHFVGDIVKEFNPAFFLNPSNSRGVQLINTINPNASNQKYKKEL